jgi:FkbM family methyltransferase
VNEIADIEAFWIYGSGEFARDLAVKMQITSQNFLGFIEFESSRINQNINVQLVRKELMNESRCVILGISNPYADVKLITKNLEEIGFKVTSPVAIASFLEKKWEIEVNNYWLTGDLDLYKRNSTDISRARLLMSEKKSLDIFDSIIDFRVGKIQFSLSHSDPKEQYLPNDLPWFKKGDTLSIIDCGAFTGDTIQSFCESGIEIIDGYCFEPDLENSEKLEETLRKLDLQNSVSISQVAAYNANTTLFFVKSGAGGSGSHLSAQSGAMEIQAVKIDDYVTSNFQVDLIKMDIEGAELAALEGCKEIIQSQSPHLAISTYHHPAHHWEIILYIQSVRPGYDFYLRTYAHQTFETILYCVPGKIPSA